MEVKHYYTNNEDLESKPSFYEYTICGKVLRFKSDLGVFSKSGLDYGTHVLIQTLLKESLQGVGLDMGCGIGPIGISLLSAFDQVSFDFVDVNDRALRLCSENLVGNHVSGKVILSNGFSQLNRKYSFIVSNPPIRQGKSFLFQLYENAKEHLLENGILYIVIRKQQGAESSVKKLKTLFENVDVIEKKSGYWIIKAQLTK